MKSEFLNAMKGLISEKIPDAHITDGMNIWNEEYIMVSSYIQIFEVGIIDHQSDTRILFDIADPKFDPEKLMDSIIRINKRILNG